MCWILNIIILCTFGIEIWRECDIMDEDTSRKVKAKCITRIAISAVITVIALLLLYKVFGVNDNNLTEYISMRKVGR